MSLRTWPRSSAPASSRSRRRSTRRAALMPLQTTITRVTITAIITVRTPTMGTVMAGKERLSRAAALRRSLTSAETLSHEALYRLMIWLSPAYPVGAFSYSSGIEWAVEAGDITDAATLREWLEAMLADGSGVNDGIFFV